MKWAGTMPGIRLNKNGEEQEESKSWKSIKTKG